MRTKPILLIAGFVAVAAAAVVLMVSTSTKPEPDKPTTQVPDKPDEPARAPSRSAETTIDRGKIVRGHALVHTFVIPNDDQTDLVIEKVKPSGSGTVEIGRAHV